MYIRDLRTGQERALVTSTDPCDSFGRPTWNAAGTRLVFADDRATATPILGPPGTPQVSCSAPRNRLAVVSAGPSRTRPRLVAPNRGCAFVSAAFRSSSIVAVEGCRQGSPRGFSDPSLGDAYLVSLTARGRIARRIALRRGLEQGLVAPEPGSEDLLITQDQPANNGGPEDDWIWVFDGTRLQPIGHYRAQDAAQVIAVPW